MLPKIIVNFVDELLKKSGLDNVPDKFQKEYSEKIGMEVQKRLGVIVMQELTPDAIDKLGIMIADEANPDLLDDFFKNNISDYKIKTEKVFTEFSDEFLDTMQNINSAK